MSKHIHTDYYQDALEKRYCYGCLKQFIVGEEIAAPVCKIHCPYCGSPKNEAVAWVDDDDTLDALGCGKGIPKWQFDVDRFSREVTK